MTIWCTSYRYILLYAEQVPVPAVLLQRAESDSESLSHPITANTIMPNNISNNLCFMSSSTFYVFFPTFNKYALGL